VASAAALLATAGTAIAQPAQHDAPSARVQEHVLVTGQPGQLDVVRRAVIAAGGHITETLKVIDGVSATVRAGAVAELRANPAVRSVSLDAHGHLMGIDPVLGYDVDKDSGSLFDVAQVTHARDAWNSRVTGQGVDVALIDSGVSPVKGLTSGNVINGPDLSFESQNPSLTDLDTFGHGTHMASIIVGRDKVASGSTYANGGSHLYVGIAPDARLVSLKVASADGGADVSQIIAAIDWVTEHAHSNGFNIKVLNLSYGTDSTQDVSLDPLDYAVENAWRAGITVVVAAGNDGTSRKALADPANDPLVLAVGADDTQGTDSIGDDVIPPFTQLGTPTRHVDVIAPGVHILGLRDPGSSIDINNPWAVVNNRFFRGSGTSQATAVVSGLAALYLSRYPTATPDQVKYALTRSANVPNSVKAAYPNGNVGVPDVNKAMSYKPPAVEQPATAATGTGSIEGSRGSSHVQINGVVLTGEQDIFGQTWDPNAWSTASAGGMAWNGGTFNGHSWTGSDWSGSSWTSSSWAGHSWTDNDWSGSSWTSNSWAGHSWTADGWDGHSWTDSAWDSDNWTSSSWADDTWG
jgi:serine protease AprX